MSRIFVAVSSPWASQRVVRYVGTSPNRIGAEVLSPHVSRQSGGEWRAGKGDGGHPPCALSERLTERGVAVSNLLMFSDDIAARFSTPPSSAGEIQPDRDGPYRKNVFAGWLAGNVAGCADQEYEDSRGCFCRRIGEGD